MKNALVIGSINMDLVIQTDHLPVMGETTTGKGFFTTLGGKGANQAVCLTKLGIPTSIIGCVGNDLYGEMLLKELKSYNVDTNGIQVYKENSGIAVITVYQGDNAIILNPGANGCLSNDIIDKNLDLLKKAEFVLYQFEVPMDTILYSAKIAKEYGAKIVLNPAPMKKVPKELLNLVDILILNETEVEQLLNINIEQEGNELEACRKLMDYGINQVIITLGSKGCVYNDQKIIKKKGIYKVEVHDTTAAGDSFLSGFLAGILLFHNVDKAIDFATATSAIVVSKLGAAASIPTQEEVLEFLKLKSK